VEKNMTYFGFLAWFVGLPILILLAVTWFDYRRGKQMPAGLSTYSPWLVLAAHVVVALLYTTPWDNYLVANLVWWYDPQKVTGIVFGWVPIEEYTFFIVQPIMTGLWFLFLARRQPDRPEKTWVNNRLRKIMTAALGSIWLVALVLWLSGAPQFVYLTLILLWALPPIMLQMVFGADILWRHGRLVLLAFGIPTLYLALADALAISTGIWTIDPAQSVNFLLGGVLPVEEFLFFLVTNVLIVLGMTLVLAAESQLRVAEWSQIVRSFFRRSPNQLSQSDKIR
jgi:lycopene cyclase domain-containing protein